MSSSEARARVEEAVEFVRRRVADAPEIAVVLGSGLGGLADELTDAVSVPYAEIPSCPRSGVLGHRGELIFGRLGDRSVAMLAGRLHLYEGHSLDDVVFPTRVLGLLGVSTLIVTNAAGGLNSEYRTGDLMLIADHINFPGLAGLNPLRGASGVAFGSQFIDPKDAYDAGLRRRVADVAARLGSPLREGVYAMVAGPSFETLAEVRMLRLVGADAVGMSTVPEVLAARQLGMRVLGISCITNLALPEAGAAAITSHGEVLETGLAAGPRLAQIVRTLIQEL